MFEYVIVKGNKKTQCHVFSLCMLVKDIDFGVELLIHDWWNYKIYTSQSNLPITACSLPRQAQIWDS